MSGEGAPGLTVVIMAYDEVQNLEPTCRAFQAALADLAEPSEVLIVDDGSRDGTGELADRLAEEAGVRVIHHRPNRGLGGVYRTGLEQAAGEWVTFIPADGQYPPAGLLRMLAARAGADLVLGDVERRLSRLGRVLTRGERLLYRLVLGRVPRFRLALIRRSLLARVPLHSRGRGWGVIMELVIKLVRGGHRVRIVPVELRPRRSGSSKVTNLRTIRSNLRQLWALRAYL